MISREFIRYCIERGIPIHIVEKYINQTMQEYYTEYDYKAVREEYERDKGK